MKRNDEASESTMSITPERKQAVMSEFATRSRKDHNQNRLWS